MSLRHVRHDNDRRFLWAAGLATTTDSATPVWFSLLDRGRRPRRPFTGPLATPLVVPTSSVLIVCSPSSEYVPLPVLPALPALVAISRPRLVLVRLPPLSGVWPADKLPAEPVGDTDMPAEDGGGDSMLWG